VAIRLDEQATVSLRLQIRQAPRVEALRNPGFSEVKTDSSERAKESVRNSEGYQHTSDHSRTTAIFRDLGLFRSFRAAQIMTFNTHKQQLQTDLK
jgi:hypothetical protein